MKGKCALFLNRIPPKNWWYLYTAVKISPLSDIRPMNMVYQTKYLGYPTKTMIYPDRGVQLSYKNQFLHIDLFSKVDFGAQYACHNAI